jgi:hypothetical protein
MTHAQRSPEKEERATMTIIMAELRKSGNYVFGSKSETLIYY